MAKKPYVFTPARRAALAKARLKRKRSSGRKYSNNPRRRGQGFSGLRRNTIPYARVNKRSQTVGFNAGTIIPFTKKRIVLGGYARIENTSRKGSIDRALSRAGDIVAPRGTGRGAVRKYISENVTVTNPAIRANTKIGQIRLGSSRGAGPTFIIRRGRHKTSEKKSKAGIKRYDTRIRNLSEKRRKKPRPQRRGK